MREANASLKEELKVAHAEGDAKDKSIADVENKLADATASAHDWHLKAKELETQLQAAKANEESARSIVAHCVTQSAPPPQGSGSQGSGSQGSQAASPARDLPLKSRNDYPIQNRPCSFMLRVGVPQGAHLRCTSA